MLTVLGNDLYSGRFVFVNINKVIGYFLLSLTANDLIKAIKPKYKPVFMSDQSFVFLYFPGVTGRSVLG